jgi:MFS family permease
VNRIIRRCGGRVAPLTVAALGPRLTLQREELPPFMALFRAGQLRWTVVGILCGVSASSAYYTCAILLPKALVDQGGAVALSFGLSSVLFMASIPGKLFTGYLMEIIGRRWTMTYSLAGSLPGIALMASAHWTGGLAAVVFTAGALITGFTVLSAFPCTRVYLSEQFPTALRGRGHFFGESSARLFSGVAFPLFLERYTASPLVFFGTLLVVVAIGAFVPLLFGRETVGQLETVSADEVEVAA